MDGVHSDSLYGRGVLPPELISVIDLELKTLRTTSRTTHSLSSVLDAEFALLDRVYYKGNSQHRSGIFWKRAAEIRRLARRAHDVKLEGLIDKFRESFFADPKNIKRVAWTKVPRQDQIHEVLQRLSSVSHLFAHAIDRCRAAYSWFVGQLRSTAFFPLAMTLIAIVARLHSVFSSLAVELVKAWQSIDSLYQRLPLELGVTRKSSPKVSRALHSLLGAEVALPSLPSGSKLAPFARETGDDLGLSISREALPVPEEKNVADVAGSQPFPSSDALTLLEEEEEDMPMDVFREDMIEDVSAVDKMAEEQQIHRPEPLQSMEEPELMPQLLQVDDTVPAPPPVTPARKKKKRKTGGDEIDAIFGF
ncbi:hypothetical protein CALVIDRAFT_599328 [Calocera viscosa TUFC12733]|uniref:Nucleolus and neural progenitor protein-like N-terminal domain-containing protein n=1 Tax=Calocera viscosa (strain TUFC12733) TaxID=1330018 RepID=A0A167KZG0_CALVF|nr:hypothetical protein CALVIDRAFT_599328 [Calocera viscosa TUFC12733]